TLMRRRSLELSSLNRMRHGISVLPHRELRRPDHSERQRACDDEDRMETTRLSDRDISAGGCLRSRSTGRLARAFRAVDQAGPPARHGLAWLGSTDTQLRAKVPGPSCPARFR